jgi:hypothetical protein
MTQPTTTTARYEIVYSEPAGELLVDNQRGRVWQLSDYFMPDLEWLHSLEVGSVAPNCFGELRWVMTVERGQNLAGKQYARVELHEGDSNISNAYTEDRLHLSLRITNRHTSHELNQIEQFIRQYHATPKEQ